MNTKQYLYREMFTDAKKTILEAGEFSAEIFRYSTGVEAVTVRNAKGFITVLPFMGQMIWRMEFLGHNLVMKSIYDEPEVCYHDYGESYGCFLMHCGLTAMGNPTPEDTHTPHGELPIAKYKTAYILTGCDEKGSYIGVGGVYSHKRAYLLNYDFMPEYRLYAGASTLEVTSTITNNKDLPLEYFYLCHINYRPVDGAKLYYTASPADIKVHHEVPEGYRPDWAAKTNEYLARLDADPSIMNTVDSATQSYAPEIVFTVRYQADADGCAHTMQQLPDGYACYVKHRPAELPFGVRWIARTDDEEAMGMVLPATAEHMGYLYCKKMGYERYLATGESTTFHITTGILTPEEAEAVKKAM